MNTPVVSIITPVYNGASYLEDTVRSVLAQTFTSWEHIFIDDGSSDGSVEVIEESCDPDRTRIIRHDRNLGIPAARNAGLEASAGRYIALVDQDDLWVPFKLERQLRLLDEGSGLCFGRHAFFRADGDRVVLVPADYQVHSGHIEEMGRDRLVTCLFKENFIGAGSVVADRRLILEAGGFNERIRGGGDDYDLWFRMAGITDFSMLSDTVLLSRVHSGNYTDTIRMTDDILAILKRVAGDVDIDERIVTERFASIHYKRFRAWFEGRDYSSAAEALRESARFAGPGGRHRLAAMLVRMRGPGRNLFFGLRRMIEISRRAGGRRGRIHTLSRSDFESVRRGERLTKALR